MSDKLTPAEVIRLGIEQGHPADVIAASLEAAEPGGGTLAAPLPRAQPAEMHQYDVVIDGQPFMQCR